MGQDDFSQRIGVNHKSNLSAMEAGRRKISPGLIRQLYTEVGVPAYLVVRALRLYANEEAAVEFQRIVTLTDDAVSLGPDDWPDPERFDSPHEWLAAAVDRTEVQRRQVAGVLKVAKSTFTELLKGGNTALTPERLCRACESIGVPAGIMFRCLAWHYRRDLEDRVRRLVSRRLPSDAASQEQARVVEAVFGGLRNMAVAVDYDDTVDFDALVERWLERTVDFVLARERLGAVLNEVMLAEQARDELSALRFNVLTAAFSAARESEMDNVLEGLPRYRAIWSAAMAGDEQDPATQAEAVRAVADGLLGIPANRHLDRLLEGEAPLDVECMRRALDAFNKWYQMVLGHPLPVVQMPVVTDEGKAGAQRAPTQAMSLLAQGRNDFRGHDVRGLHGVVVALGRPVAGAPEGQARGHGRSMLVVVTRGVDDAHAFCVFNYGGRLWVIDPSRGIDFPDGFDDIGFDDIDLDYIEHNFVEFNPNEIDPRVQVVHGIEFDLFGTAEHPLDDHDDVLDLPPEDKEAYRQHRYGALVGSIRSPGRDDGGSSADEPESHDNRGEFAAVLRTIAPLCRADPDRFTDRLLDPDRFEAELERIRTLPGISWRRYQWLRDQVRLFHTTGSVSMLRPLREQEQRFDPSRPVSVSNMPPLDELEFVPLPDSTKAVLVRLKPEPARRYGRRHHRKIAVYKPLPADRLRNEITAWLVARLLGLDNVPETCQWVGPFGEGTLQEYVDGRRARLDPRGLQSQQLAVLDYVLAQLDRGPQNELFVKQGRLFSKQGRRGRAWAIDNEKSLPEPHSRPRLGPLRIMSSRVRANFRHELNAPMVDKFGHELTRLDDSGRRVTITLAEWLRDEVDAERLRDLFLSLGHSASSAGWAVQRLQEIQQNGRITGDAWNREFGDPTNMDSEHIAGYRPRPIKTNCLIGVLRKFEELVSGNREVYVDVPDIVDVDAVDLTVAPEAIHVPRGFRTLFGEFADGAVVHDGLRGWAQMLERQRRWSGNGVLAIVAKPGRTKDEPGHTVLWSVATFGGEARVFEWDPDDPEGEWKPWQPARDRDRQGPWQAAFFRADGTPVIAPVTDTRDPGTTQQHMMLVAQSRRDDGGEHAVGDESPEYRARLAPQQESDNQVGRFGRSGGSAPTSDDAGRRVRLSRLVRWPGSGGLLVGAENCAVGVCAELSQVYPGRRFRIGGWPSRRGVRARALFEAVNSTAQFATYAEVVARLQDED
ncbi:MAG: hypothetical protein J2P17_11395, partial [Mycobacterium sp.]|nr:hypothetical protein [Mycobacterium sp.]